MYKIPEKVFLNGNDDLSTNSIRVLTIETGEMVAAAIVRPKNPDKNEVVVDLFFACLSVNKSEIIWILEKYIPAPKKTRKIVGPSPRHKPANPCAAVMILAVAMIPLNG
jgi:hypothetical protein